MKWSLAWPDAGNVLRRFPVPSLLLLAGAVLSIAAWNAKGSWFWQYWLATAFAVALAGQLWAQAQLPGHTNGRTAAGSWKPHVAAALATLAIGLLAMLQIISRGGERWPHLLHPADGWFLSGGLAMLFLSAPFLGRRHSGEAQWRFGLNILLATFVCLGAGLAIGAGVALAVNSAEFLFRLNALPWLVPTVLLATPWLAAFLAMGVLPDDAARTPVEADFDRGGVRLLLRFLNWVAAPLLLLHGAILNLYALKILAQWELPRGGVGWMVGSFTFFGTITWLLGQAPALRGRGGPLLNWFVHRWWWLLVAPFVLLVIGVWRRISDYGVTPSRYLLALMAVWTGFALVLWFWRGARASSRALISLAGALLLLGALAGPFSARNMSVRSQMAQLQAMLSGKGLLDAQQRLAKTVPAGTWTEKERTHVKSTLQKLLELDAGERVLAIIAPPAVDEARLKMLADESGTQRKRQLRALLEQALGLRAPASRWRWVFMADLPSSTEVPPGMMLSGPYVLGRPRLPVGRRWDGHVPGTPLRIALRDGVLTLTGQRGDVWRLPAATLLAMARRSSDKRQELGVEGMRWIYARPMEITLAGGSRLVVKRFRLSECRGRRKSGAKTSGCGIEHIDFLLLFPAALLEGR